MLECGEKHAEKFLDHVANAWYQPWFSFGLQPIQFLRWLAGWSQRFRWWRRLECCLIPCVRFQRFNFVIRKIRCIARESKECKDDKNERWNLKKRVESPEKNFSLFLNHSEKKKIVISPRRFRVLKAGADSYLHFINANGDAASFHFTWAFLRNFLVRLRSQR